MDRLSSEGYQTDKGGNYLTYYESFFSPHRHRALNFLELGINRGGSLQMWRDYFTYGQIFGVDINAVSMPESPRIHTFVGDVCDPGVFQRIEAETGVGVFDIIIDDASHMGASIRTSFEHLFPERLAPGGIYVIEDWGVGYWEQWPDGEALKAGAHSDEGKRMLSHQAGAAGYVKVLVDHAARTDVERGGGSLAAFPIEFMTITSGLVFIKKLG